MPGKASEGFTKSAQNAKFIRHRDCKLKDGEQKKEDNIARVMCEGVCRRCREKSQWRFKYDKYKPLKKPASCSVCKNKTITKAYRTMCDACASKSKKCSSCCISMAEAHKADAALEAALDAVLQSRENGDEDSDTEFGCVVQSLEDVSISKPAKVTSSSSASAIKSVPKATEGSDEEDDEEEDDEEGEQGSDEEEEEGSEGEDEDAEEGEEDDLNSDGEEISDDENEGDDTFTVEQTPVTVFGALTKNMFTTTTSMSDNVSVASEVSINAEIKLMDVLWDERKFNNMAASKYSKNRVVGKEEGQIY